MPGVLVSWLFPEDTSGWFTYSLGRMLRYDAQGNQHICRPEGGLLALSSGPRVAEARNQIVDLFADVHPDTEWLLMLDSDMTFNEDLVDRLVEAADPKTAPIVGGLCFAGGRSHQPYPTVYRELDVVDGYINIERVYDYPRDRLLKVGATGGACLFMHRDVLARMKAPHPNGFGTLPNGNVNNYPWFSEGLVGPHGEPLGEDIAFCKRAGLLGIPVHVHTGIKLGHMKVHEIDEAYYLKARSEVSDNGNGPTPTRAERRRAARELARVS
jgi:hypothetical protein